MLKRGILNNLQSYPQPQRQVYPPSPSLPLCRKGVDMRIKRDLCPDELAAAPHFSNLRAASETVVADAGELAATGAWLLPLIPRVGEGFGSHGKERRLRLHAEQLPQWKLIEAI